MPSTAHEMHEAETRGAAAESGTNAHFEVWKSKASDVLSSPYVRGAAVLGITAAGYALLRRKKAPASNMAPERRVHPGDLLKAGSFLVSLVASIASAMTHASVDAPAAAQKEPE